MLSRKTRYALMAMTVLARSYGEAPVPMSRIASTKNIPLRFLEGILLQLKKAGFLESTRGIDGGYRLSKPPGDITLLEIIRQTEGPMTFVSCLESCGTSRCEFDWDMESCGIRRTFSAIHSEMEAKLGRLTLEDILQ